MKYAWADRILATAIFTAAVALATLAPGQAASADGSAGVVPLAGSSAPARPDTAVQSEPAAATVELGVSLALRDPRGAVEFERAVSDPAASHYRKYLSAAQWEQRFSPSQATVEAVSRWLHSEGVSVEGVSPDRLTINASAPVATVEKAFGTNLAEYSVDGRLVRLASGPLSVPTELAPLITSISGVNQKVLRPTSTGLPGRNRQFGESGEASNPDTPAAEKPIPPPEWPLTPPPCSGYWGEKTDRVDPPFGSYTDPLPYGTCGYVPAQLQGAYNLSGPIAAGDDGSGETVAITDAYASPTLFSDVREWSKRNDPGQLLKASQFKEVLSGKFNFEDFCEASGWSIEQTLDVESVHATAPGAKIVYVAGKNCFNSLFGAVQQVVDEHLADVVTNSWGDEGIEGLTPPAEFRAFDNVLLMAAGTGIGVLFAGGDDGDEFSDTGGYAPGYPPESPYDTAVGGTSLKIDKQNRRSEELGWSNSISTLCSAVVEQNEETVEFVTEQPIECDGTLFGKWLPPAPGGYWAGGYGGTSYEYPEPAYQEGVVPQALALRHSAATHEANRVVPDISFDADPFTGLKMGETLAEPGGGQYEEFPIGGTSLSSPLLAGEIADADQAAGVSLGFINPLIYRLAAASRAGAFSDILPPANKQAYVNENYANNSNSEDGLFTTVRTLGYEGDEAFCGTRGGRCIERKITLHAAKGFDSMTGIGSPGPQFLKDLAKP